MDTTKQHTVLCTSCAQYKLYGDTTKQHTVLCTSCAQYKLYGDTTKQHTVLCTSCAQYKLYGDTLHIKYTQKEKKQEKKVCEGSRLVATPMLKDDNHSHIFSFFVSQLNFQMEIFSLKQTFTISQKI